MDAAIAPYLEHLASGIVMVEGYAQQGPRDEQYLRSRARASIVRDYLVGTFHLDPQATGAMPLSADSTGSPGKAPWDGVALAVILNQLWNQFRIDTRTSYRLYRAESTTPAGRASTRAGIGRQSRRSSSGRFSRSFRPRAGCCATRAPAAHPHPRAVMDHDDGHPPHPRRPFSSGAVC